MRTLRSGLLVLAFATASIVTSSAKAIVYEVDRAFSTVTLIGTVELPLGNYVIQNSAPNPFTAVNLTLTVNATPYNLTNALTGTILGTGVFTIDATPTTLTFTANGNGTNPADLVFSDNFDPLSFNRYAIGSNGSPMFETAITTSGVVSNNSLRFPTVFGNAIPEPSTITLCAVAVLGICVRRRESR